MEQNRISAKMTKRTEWADILMQSWTVSQPARMKAVESLREVHPALALINARSSAVAWILRVLGMALVRRRTGKLRQQICQ
jgi:hypothetical protein